MSAQQAYEQGVAYGKNIRQEQLLNRLRDEYSNTPSTMTEKRQLILELVALIKGENNE